MFRLRKSKGSGKTATRVTNLLIDALNLKYPGKSIGIAPEDFWFQKGDYMKGTWDLARWGATIPIPGSQFKITLYCWDTMKQCTKGLDLTQGDHDSPDEYEVVAKADAKAAKPPKPPDHPDPPEEVHEVDEADEPVRP